MTAHRNSTPMATPPTEHDPPPTPDRRPPPSPPNGVRPMYESRPSSDRHFVSAAAEMYRERLEFWLDDPDDDAGPADCLMAPEDDEDFVRGVFMDFEEQLDDLGCRIAVVVEFGRLEAGRRRALYEMIVASGELLLDLAYSVKTDGGRSAP